MSAMDAPACRRLVASECRRIWPHMGVQGRRAPARAGTGTDSDRVGEATAGPSCGGRRGGSHSVVARRRDRSLKPGRRPGVKGDGRAVPLAADEQCARLPIQII